ncbi:MAG: hypothetical protein NT136_03675 [Candidatus Moranbacteria bacterium]|nr:hypothetical protein [Candidatus Moranbacteria bacterium]
MNYQHQQLALGRWQKLSFFEQMANVGSEIERTIKWRNKGNQQYSRQAFDRALELMDLTIRNSKKKSQLRELLRVREALADYFIFNNDYQSSDEKWQNYFYCFNFAARLGR